MRRQRDTAWLVNGTLLTPRGARRGALGMQEGRIAAIRAAAPRGAERINVDGRYVAPGFIDLHVWGAPELLAREMVKSGTTGFLASLGPQAPEQLVNRLTQLRAATPTHGARFLGVHLEGPFLNPFRAGALASRWLRPPTMPELRQLVRHAGGRLKLVTLAPELPKSIEAIRWLRRHGVAVSLGHTDASPEAMRWAAKAGATLVTHVFNGMRPFHHRDPGALGEALLNDQLAAMVILDRVHIDPAAFGILWRCKGAERLILVTDSIEWQPAKGVATTGGAYYTGQGVLAGSRLTMIEAVRHAVEFGKISVAEAVRMTSLNPARAIGMDRQLGSIDPGKRADLVIFDQRFRIHMTFVNGRVVHQ